MHQAWERWWWRAHIRAHTPTTNDDDQLDHLIAIKGAQIRIPFENRWVLSLRKLLLLILSLSSLVSLQCLLDFIPTTLSHLNIATTGTNVRVQKVLKL